MRAKLRKGIDRVFLFVLYAMLGVTTEVCYTALVNLQETWAIGSPDWTLRGVSYIWMVPIYGIASILFPWGYANLSKWPRLLRYLAYAVVMMTVEFITGFAIEQITGQCPWNYQTGWRIGPYVRVDYLPLWMLFGAAMEEFHLLTRKLGER